MTGALTVREEQTDWTTPQLAALRQMGVEKATTGDLQLFLSYCQRTGLDPFSRQVYMIGRWNNRARRQDWTIQTSIDGLRIVAQRSHEYQGQTMVEWYDGERWVDVWTAGVPPLAARVGVWRAGFRDPLYAVAHWTEYNASGPVWDRMPALMLAKCAESLALRKAFPQDLAGLYTTEEMAQAGGPAPVELTDEQRRESAEMLADAVRMADDEDALRALWRDAAGLKVLDVNVGDGTVGDLIRDRREELLAEIVVTSEVVEEVGDADADRVG